MTFLLSERMIGSATWILDWFKERLVWGYMAMVPVASIVANVQVPLQSIPDEMGEGISCE